LAAAEKEPTGPEKDFVDEAKRQWEWFERELESSK
jgi:hypothetical protein